MNPKEKTGANKEEKETPKTYSLPEKSDDWLCYRCLNRIANERQRYLHDNQSEFVFTNPLGVKYEIITFKDTVGIINYGDLTNEFTWFEGYAWSFALCSSCNQHLGWRYENGNYFYGLIKDRLIRTNEAFN